MRTYAVCILWIHFVSHAQRICGSVVVCVRKCRSIYWILINAPRSQTMVRASASKPPPQLAPHTYLPPCPRGSTHLRHEFDVVSLVTFKIVFNYFLTSSSVKSVGRCRLVIGAWGVANTPLPQTPLPPLSCTVAAAAAKTGAGSVPFLVVFDERLRSLQNANACKYTYTYIHIHSIYTKFPQTGRWENIDILSAAALLQRCFHQSQISENRRATAIICVGCWQM